MLRLQNLLLVFVLTLAPQALSAENEDSAEEATPSENAEVLAGHSDHGGSFNEGPRQAAYLMQGMGNVHFPATCKTEEVQKFIDQGVGQLHGFWYFESERSFRQAAFLDPDCAIAYWGMAMSNRSNESRARGFIEEAVKRKENASAREQLYIDALAKYFKEPARKEGEKVDRKKKAEEDKKRRQTLVKDYEDLLHKHPDDIEAKALLGLALYENKSKGIPISSYYAVDALLNDILDKNPLHPCHHFRIHLWDYEEPVNALNSAALCGESEPAVAHMWHMPGHIYSRLKRYHDAVWQQEASARTDHAYMMRDRVIPDQIHNFAHNNEWLIRNLIHIGRSNDALDLAKNMIDLPRHPKYNTLSKQGSTKYGRMRLTDTLSTFQLWEETLKLSETIYLEPTESETEQQKRDTLVAVAKFHTNDTLGACELLTRFKQELTELEAERDKAVEEAIAKVKDEGKDKEKDEKKEEKAQKAAGEAAKRKFSSKIRTLTTIISELEGHLHLIHGAHADALASFSKVSTFDKGWLAFIQQQAGETDKAISAINKHVSSHKGEVVPLAWKVAVLWDADKKEDAKKAFEELRAISSTIDLNTPVFQQLQPIAEELGFEADWRLPREIPEDFGDRPNLAELGPFRWSPSAAPEFALNDHLAKTHSLADYSGKPVVVIFYLGYGCLHCAQQLQAFAPETEKFKDAGISLIAISTDNQEDLKNSHENYGKETFPFPLISNSELDIFKAYRCYDDFEQKTLHGTFLIDAKGEIRWQDISYEPFMDADFLLKESKRLLAQPSDDSKATRQSVTATP
ncbi:redoxin domain-containing protein [Thalassoglobus sp.]|uniref:redoxin domain-containing protein n=1 Tax=Thalassoglobus sp. TaxID=2795869 RepID=UPI003AA852CC